MSQLLLGGSGFAGEVFAFVFYGVVAAAFEFGVVEVGLSAVYPVFDVVGVAPAGRPVTALDDASLVSEYQGAAESWGDGAGSAPHIEGFGGALGDDAADGSVTGDTAGSLGGDNPGLVQLARFPSPGFQRLQGHQQRNVRLLTPLDLGVTMIEVVAAQLNQGISPALLRSASISGISRLG